VAVGEGGELGDTVVTDMPLTGQAIVNESNGEDVLLNGTLHQEMSNIQLD